MIRLQYGICGSIAARTEPEDNPYTYLQQPGVQAMLLSLNSNPLSLEDLKTAHPELREQIAAMTRLQMLHQDQLVRVNFTLLDQRDKQIVWQVSDAHARELARLIAAKQADIHAVLKPLASAEVSVQQLAFLALGCYLLDWGALSLLQRWGALDKEKPQAGNNVYTLWAEVEQADSLKAVYWGGHSMQVGDFLLHTFGDHDPGTRRMALPDILYRVHNGDLPGREYFRVLQLRKNKEIGHQLAEILDLIGREGCTGEKLTSVNPTQLPEMLSLLKALHYVGQPEQNSYLLKIPYFTGADLPTLRCVAHLVVPLLQQWVNTQLEQYRHDIGSINSLQNGVPFNEVLVHCWHYVFGLANKRLAEWNVITDTYCASSRWRGYQPGLMQAGLVAHMLPGASSYGE
jgi:hypothetical protein